MSLLKMNIQNYTILLSTFRTISYLISSVLLIPFEEIFFTIIVCDSEQYFKNKMNCWSSKHYLYIAFSILFLLITIFITILYHTFSFEQKNSFLKIITKYLIMNSKRITVIFNCTYIILLELQCVKDILNILICVFMPLSLLNFYCYYIEQKYTFYKDFKGRLFYIFNAIHCVNTIILFIAFLLRKENINGFFELFLIFVVLIALIEISNPSKYLIKLKSNFILKSSEIEIYRILNMIINNLTNEMNNRSDLLNIYGFFSVQKIFIGEKHFGSQSKNMSNDDLKYKIFEYLDILFKKSINNHRDSVLLLANYGIFQLEKLEKYNLAYLTLNKAYKNKYITMIEEYFIFRIMKKIEDKAIEDGFDKTNISYKYQTNMLINLISKITLNYNHFWNLLLNSSEGENLYKLNKYGYKINYLIETIHNHFERLKESNFHNKRIFKLYGYYIRDILNDPILAKNYIYFDDTNVNEIKFNSKVMEINALTPSNDFQYMIISGKKEIFGVIINVSLDICSYLGYSQNDLIGKKIDILIPDIIKSPHRKMLKEKIEKNRNFDYENDNIKTLEMLFKTSSKYLYPFYMDVSFLYDEDYNKIIFAKVNYEQFINLENSFIIMLDKNFYIKHYTVNCCMYLEINDKSNDIFLYIKELSEDYTNKLNKINEKDKDEEKLKIKFTVIKKYLLSEKDIVWKNNKKLKLKIKEIIINKILCGFIFYLDKSEYFYGSIYDSTLTISNNNNTNSNNNNRLSPLTAQINNKDFPSINKNYLPKLNEKIMFNIDDKIFLFKDQKSNTLDDNIYNYFSKNVLEKFKKPNSIVDKKSTKNSDENEEEEEDDEEKEEEEEEENLEESELIEKKNKNEFKNDENNYLNNNNNNNLNHIEEYYKIKLDSIKFYVYNYDTKIVDELNDFVKIGKVEEIIETEKTKNNYLLHGINNKNINKKLLKKNSSLSLTNEPTDNQTKKFDFNSRKLSAISKRTLPNFINTSIYFFLFLYIIILIFEIVFCIIYYNKVYSYENNIKNLNNFIIYLCKLFRDILHTYFFSFEVILLHNPKYTNFYENKKRDTYYKNCIGELKKIYYESLDNLQNFSFNSIKLYKKNEDLLNKTLILVHSFNIFDDLTLEINSTYMKLSDSLSEFDYSLYCFYNKEYDEINAMDEDAIFLIFNIDNNLAGLMQYITIYFSEMKMKIDFIILNIVVYFVVCFIVQISMIFLGLKANTLIIKEKLNNILIFFKLNENQINSILSKSTKFLRLNGEKAHNIISEPKINLEEDNFSSDTEENNNLLQINNPKNKYNNILFPIKKRRKRKRKQKFKLFNHRDIKINLFFTIIFYSICLILLLYTTIYFSISIKKIYYYDMIYYSSMLIEKNCMTLVNYIRSYILFFPMIIKSKFLTDLYTPYMMLDGVTYPNLGRFFKYMTRNLTKHGLPNKDLEKLYFNLEELNICEYGKDFIKEYELECSDISANVSYYGLSSILSFYVDSVYYLLPYSVINEDLANQSPFTYNEMYYGTDKYEALLPTDPEQLIAYNDQNPFNIFNHKILKEISVEIFIILRNLFQNITDSFSSSISDNLKNIKKRVKFINTLYFVILGLSYIFYILPYAFEKNVDINKTRKMLSIIPKNILYNLLIDKKDKINTNEK